jgi:uncharacterized membrane protein
VNRTLLKTGTYCLMHLTVAIAVAFALTRNWQAALAIGLVEPFVQTFAFAIHERLWSKRAQSPPPGANGPCAHVRLWPPSKRADQASGDGALA